MEILSGANSMEEREFYMKLALKEKLSFRELQRQINSSYYERVMLADVKLSPLARELPQDVSNTFKDTYVFELLHLPEEHQEKDLLKAIARNITKFLLEFGRDFAFMVSMTYLRVLEVSELKVEDISNFNIFDKCE